MTCTVERAAGALLFAGDAKNSTVVLMQADTTALPRVLCTDDVYALRAAAAAAAPARGTAVTSTCRSSGECDGLNKPGVQVCCSASVPLLKRKCSRHPSETVPAGNFSSVDFESPWNCGRFFYLSPFRLLLIRNIFRLQIARPSARISAPSSLRYRRLRSLASRRSRRRCLRRCRRWDTLPRPPRYRRHHLVVAVLRCAGTCWPASRTGRS